MSEPREDAERLLNFLQKHKEDRGLMADLRCGFSPAREHRAWPHIARFCRLDKDWSRLPVQTVCAAYATHPMHRADGNLGATMRRIEMPTIEHRFQRMLACQTREEICAQVSSVIRTAKAKGVAVDYQQLYLDLVWWEGKYPPRLKWADAYWGTAGGEE